MRSKIKYILLFVVLLFILTTCKKYPEGGFVYQTRLHLFGGHKVGDSKTWKLKLYEVNGIDSTNLIQGANSIPDFYDNFVTFVYKKSDPSAEFTASTFLYDYGGSIDAVSKKLNLSLSYIKWTHEDSLQCKNKNNVIYCNRNILIPEVLKRVSSWNINKLTKGELIISVQLSNFYKIILNH